MLQVSSFVLLRDSCRDLSFMIITSTMVVFDKHVLMVLKCLLNFVLWSITDSESTSGFLLSWCCCRSDLTKDQMIADLVFKRRILLWSGIVLGSLSIGILGYAIMRSCAFCQ